MSATPQIPQSKHAQTMGDYAAKVAAAGFAAEAGKATCVVLEKTVKAALPIIAANPVAAASVVLGGYSAYQIGHTLSEYNYEREADPSGRQEFVERWHAYQDSDGTPEERGIRDQEIAHEWEERRAAAEANKDKSCVLM